LLRPRLRVVGRRRAGQGHPGALRADDAVRGAAGGGRAEKGPGPDGGGAGAVRGDPSLHRGAGGLMPVKVLLIGLDGGTFSVLDPMGAHGVMPFLGRFLAEGVRASLRTIVPPLTPPAWTSLATGRTPGHHGVFDFFRMDSPETRHIRFFTSHDVQCETIWTLASARGLRVTALNFPSMFPAPRLAGNVVPGWVPW